MKRLLSLLSLLWLICVAGHSQNKEASVPQDFDAIHSLNWFSSQLLPPS